MKFLTPLIFTAAATLTLNIFAADGDAVFPEPDALPVIAGLPELLVDAHGQRVTTPEQWMARREELKAVIEHYSTGKMPPAPDNLRAEILQTLTVMDGKAVYELVRLSFGADRQLRLEVSLYRPAQSSAPCPVVVYPSFATSVSGSPRGKFKTAEQGAGSVAAALARGYAVLAFDYQQAALDEPNNRSSGFFPAYPDYDWGTIAAWAWAASRGVDYLLTRDDVDRQRIAVTGFSRLGKAALVAGAFDERITLTLPCGSGCGGTAAFRFTGGGLGGEGIDHLTTAFPHWFHPRLQKFIPHVDKLPFDQHGLIALVAPRALLSEDGAEDGGVNASAVKKSYWAAKPVYQLLDADGQLGIYFRAGGHAFGKEDWDIILDFADKILLNKTVTRDFTLSTPTAW